MDSESAQALRVLVLAEGQPVAEQLVYASYESNWATLTFQVR